MNCSNLHVHLELASQHLVQKLDHLGRLEAFFKVLVFFSKNTHSMLDLIYRIYPKIAQNTLFSISDTIKLKKMNKCLILRLFFIF